MKKLLPTVIALALAIVSLLPGLAAAKLAGNRSQTLIRASKLLGAVIAVGFALTALLPGIAAARLVGNHNQTRLTG